jgi:hypothetical protein
MLADIEQAEDAIRKGDTKTGFEILRGYLADNPDSERAWWVMSGLVQRDQRVTCLEQVLRINPDNQFASEALEKLLAAPREPETKPPREIPQLQPTPQPARKAPRKSALRPAAETTQKASAPAVDKTPEKELQTWLHARGPRIFLTILAQKRLTRAVTSPDLLSAVQAALQKGRVPDQLLSDMQTIPLKVITSINRLKGGLLVYYQDGVDERSLRLVLAGDEMTDRVLGILKEQLGPAYFLVTEPGRGGLNLAFSLVLTILAAALSAYLYWASLEVSSGRAAAGSVRAAWVINLIQALGQLGVVLLGAVLILAALGISAFLLLNPPTRTRLVRR